MQAQDQKAILAIALQAAFADGTKDDREREEIRRMADSLATASSAVDLRTLYQDVLLKRFTLDHAVAALSDEGLRHYAYEMALCVRGRWPYHRCRAPVSEHPQNPPGLR